MQNLCDSERLRLWLMIPRFRSLGPGREDVLILPSGSFMPAADGHFVRSLQKYITPSLVACHRFAQSYSPLAIL